MKPHVARFEDVEAKVRRCFMEDVEGEGMFLLRMQRREGKDRNETVALILTEGHMRSDVDEDEDKDNEEGEEKKEEKDVSHEELMFPKKQEKSEAGEGVELGWLVL